MTITIYIDPGHGWGKVNVNLLKEWGILDKISAYSYVSNDGEFYYLEEDRDLSIFREKVGKKNIELKVTEKYFFDRENFIRRLNRVVKPLPAPVEQDGVYLIASGYEWTCYDCDNLNNEIEVTEKVQCQKCGKIFDVADHEHAIE